MENIMERLRLQVQARMATGRSSNPAPSSQSGEIRFVMQGFQEILINNLLSMYQDSQLCDLTFKLSKGDEIHVHSCVLAAFSPTIADIMCKADISFHEKGEMSHRYILVHVKRFSALVMRAIIEMVYTGRFHLESSSPLIIKQLLEAARWLKMQRLITVLEKITGVKKHPSDADQDICIHVVVSGADRSVLFNTKTTLFNARTPSAPSSSSSSSSLPSSSSQSSSKTVQTMCSIPQGQRHHSESERVNPPPPPLMSQSIESQSQSLSHHQSSTSAESSRHNTSTSSETSSLVNKSKSLSAKLQQQSTVSSNSVMTDSSNSKMIMTETEHEAVPEIKMEVDDLSEFLSSCDDLNAVNVEQITGCASQSQNNSTGGDVVSGVNGTDSESLMNANEIKEEVQDEEDCKYGDMEMASFLSRYIDTNYSLIHDHVYTSVPEKPSNSNGAKMERDVRVPCNNKDKENVDEKPRNETTEQMGLHASTSREAMRTDIRERSGIEASTGNNIMRKESVQVSRPIHNTYNKIVRGDRDQASGINANDKIVRKERDRTSIINATKLIVRREKDKTGIDDDVTSNIVRRERAQQIIIHTHLANKVVWRERDQTGGINIINATNKIVRKNQDQNQSGLGTHNKITRKEERNQSSTSAVIATNEIVRRKKDRTVSPGVTTLTVRREKSDQTTIVDATDDTMSSERGKRALDLTVQMETGLETKLRLREPCSAMNDTLTWNDFNRNDSQVENYLENFAIEEDEEGRPTFICDKCDAWFIHKVHYEEHIADHPLFPCSQCPAQFYRVAQLQRHTKSLHGFGHGHSPSELEQLEVQQEVQQHVERLMRITEIVNAAAKLKEPTMGPGRSQRVKCPECKYTALSAAELCRHSKVEHNQPKPLKCTVEGCKFRATRPSDIAKHVRNTHASGKGTAITCSRCKAVLKNKTTFFSHRKVCLKLSTCLCEVCGKKFTSRQNLALHVRTIHGGLRRYKCQRCSDSFSCHGNLTRHMRLHNNAVPYLCSDCGRKFRHSNTLKQHKATVHGD